jgi:hypothetical protein
VNVYRHPRVRGVAHEAGAPVPPEVPLDTPPGRLLLLTRGDEAPSVAGADLAARVLIAPRQLPVGALTALVGVPLFLALMYRQRS